MISHRSSKRQKSGGCMPLASSTPRPLRKGATSGTALLMLCWITWRALSSSPVAAIPWKRKQQRPWKRHAQIPWKRSSPSPWKRCMPKALEKAQILGKGSTGFTCMAEFKYVQLARINENKPYIYIMETHDRITHVFIK